MSKDTISKEFKFLVDSYKKVYFLSGKKRKINIKVLNRIKTYFNDKKFLGEAYDLIYENHAGIKRSGKPQKIDMIYYLSSEYDLTKRSVEDDLTEMRKVLTYIERRYTETDIKRLRYFPTQKSGSTLTIDLSYILERIKSIFKAGYLYRLNKSLEELNLSFDKVIGSYSEDRENTLLEDNELYYFTKDKIILKNFEHHVGKKSETSEEVTDEIISRFYYQKLMIEGYLSKKLDGYKRVYGFDRLDRIKKVFDKYFIH